MHDIEQRGFEAAQGQNGFVTGHERNGFVTDSGQRDFVTGNKQTVNVQSAFVTGHDFQSLP
ncbi:MAG: hypothetical protein WA476_19915 [Acidobacteriaceae bacterium]